MSEGADGWDAGSMANGPAGEPARAAINGFGRSGRNFLRASTREQVEW